VPTIVNLSPIADNTLYQDPAGQLSNGAGPHLFVGTSNQGTNNIRRGAIKFDLSSVPAGSIITSATLTMRMSRPNNGAQPIVLHRALRNWGEGASNAAQGGTGPRGGDGVQAAANDATWVFSFFNSQRWTTAGGDFVAAASATTVVNTVASYQWTGAGMAADVQQWVNNPAINFGWIMTANEAARPTAKEFETKESPIPANRPVLTIDYTPAAPDLAIAKTHTGIFRPGQTGATYSVTVSNVSSVPTNGSTVTVTDTLPAGLSATTANSGTINGWTVSFSGQTVTATRSDVLQGGGSYPVLTVTVNVANNIANTVVNTVTVAGGGDVNAANNTATDPTVSVPVADLVVRVTPTGSFSQGAAAAVYVLTVTNIGLGSTSGPVTVTATLPAGLTPTAANRGVINGWTVSVSGQTVTATRNDVLASGASYPVLPLTVSVATSAPATVTTVATVSGGGEDNTDNNTAAVVTPIVQVRRRRGA
jgi:uncharacterized repeat protein (TIGR01451 family)